MKTVTVCAVEAFAYSVERLRTRDTIRLHIEGDPYTRVYREYYRQDELAAGVKDLRDRGLPELSELGVHYVLVDVNPHFYNCGHYPEWVVEERPGPLPTGRAMPTTRSGRPMAFSTREEAEAAAGKKNAASTAAWHDFLNDR